MARKIQHTGRTPIKQITDGCKPFAEAVRGRKAPRFTEDQKRAAVKALLGGKANGTELALKLGTYPGVIYRWAQDARFGGRAGGLSGTGTGSGIPEAGQPKRKGARKAARNGNGASRKLKAAHKAAQSKRAAGPVGNGK